MNKIAQKIKSSGSYAQGVATGILSAMAFGFIPVFSKPMLSEGMSTECVLFYRFAIAALILAVIIKVQGKSLTFPKRYVPSMTLEAVFYSFSGGFLVLGYNFMSGGVTGVLHFTYPIFVMVISLLFFKEKIRIASAVAIVIAIVGIYCLGVHGGDEAFVPGANRVLGVIIVVCSGLACASYMVGVNKTKAHELPNLVFTMWLLAISALFFFVISLADGTLQMLQNWTHVWRFVGLSFVATVIANFLLVHSIHNVGSTLAAILGALEPATAIVMCILLFGESLNLPICAGIVLILVAVMIVIMRSKQTENDKEK